MEKDNKDINKVDRNPQQRERERPDATYLVVHFGIQVEGVGNKWALARR